MSTKSSIYFAVDDNGIECHFYWELAERIPRVAAPIYVEFQNKGLTTKIRLPKETAAAIAQALGEKDWEVL